MSLLALLLPLALSATSGRLSPSTPPASPGGEADEDPNRQWGNWRGPGARGHAPQATPPLTWSEEQNLRWKAALPGHGKSTPIVWGDQVFVLYAEATGEPASAEQLAARPRYPDALTERPQQLYSISLASVDRATGERRWETELRRALPVEGVHETNGYASSSPVTDGRRLYVSLGSQGVFCCDLEGEVLWSHDLPPMHTRKGWGEGASPALGGSTLVVPFDQEDASFVVAYDAESGEERWRQPREEPTTWATPLVLQHDERWQAILNGTERVRSYDLESGSVLWECGGQTVNAIPSPVTANGLVYCLSGYRGEAAYALPLDQRGDLSGTEAIRWELHQGTPYVPSPALADGRLWFTSKNSSLLSCVDAATGTKILDRERLPGMGNLYASPVLAAGRLYLLDREGTTVVLDATADSVKVLAINQLDGNFDASPAAVGAELFLRSESALYCIAEEAPRPTR